MAKIENFYNSWRTDVIELQPNGLTDHAFLTTKPNLIYVKNPNNTYLYFGLKTIPTPYKYEFEILPHSYDTFGQPNGTGHLYIYNPSNETIFIEVYSQFDEFNIAILKNYSLAVNEVKVNGEMQFKPGYQLPAGSNKIGSVDISQNQINALTNSMNVIKKALIGNKDVDSENLLTFIDGLELVLSKIKDEQNPIIINGVGNLVGLLGTSNNHNFGILNNSNDIKNVVNSISEYIVNDVIPILNNLLSGSNVTGKTNLFDLKTLLESIRDKQVELNVESLPETDLTTVHSLLMSVDNLLRDWAEERNYREANHVYLNNVNSFSYEAYNSETIHFSWLFNDGGDTTLYLKTPNNGDYDERDIFTMKSGEAYTDMDISLDIGQVLEFRSSTPMYRIKYWSYLT